MTDATLPSGIETESFDEGVRPQDDLYRHVNGGWFAENPIPEDRARYGTFHQLHEQAEAAVRVIVEEAQQGAPGTVERLVGDVYASFMDEERIRALGTAPLEPLLAAIDGIESVEAFVEHVAAGTREGGPGFFRMGSDTDPGDPTRYVAIMLQGGLGLPDESYYREERFAETRSTYLATIDRMLALAGLDDTAARAARVLELESALALGHWDNVRSRDAEATYNLRRWSDVEETLRSANPNLDFGLWLRALNAPAGSFDEVVLHQPSYLEALVVLLSPERLPAWLDWLRWHTVRGLASYLTDELVEASFDFYGRTLTGTPALRERWKRGVSLVEGSLGEAVGRVYVDRHFPPAAKDAMDVLVANLIEAYRRSIVDLEWMSAETRGKALVKLEKFTPKIGYPVRWRDYSSLVIDPADLVGNVRRVNAHEFDREYGKIGGPVDRDEWFMTPQTVNAYYNPGMNEIVFPAAILQYPFFTPERDAAANYGAIGAVIGHEISHGFDDQGSKYDGDGRLTDWWTESDRAAFEERTAALIAQYDELSPEGAGGEKVKGALTVGENIADLSGLAIAWKAYLLSLDGEEPEELDGLTGAQRFLLSWAQAWRQIARPEETIRLLAIDPHSPPEFRCNQVVRNLETFYDAFKVQDGDTLWMDPAARVSIW